MNFPPGAITTTEEMQAMIGKPVYMALPKGVGSDERRISPYIIKFHPTDVEKVPNDDGNPHHYWLKTKENVNAAEMKAISVRKNWSTSWGVDPVFFFSNFWFAQVYAQHAENLRV